MTACLFSHFVHLKPYISSVSFCDLTGGTFQYLPATGPWEAQNVTTGETIGSDLSHITTAYASTTANPLTNFASYGCTGYMDGVISGTGPWTIQSGTQTIGTVPWVGTGLIISTADNTITGMTTLQAGSHLQLGATVNSTTGKTGTVTINTGAILDIFGANGPTATTKVGAVTNTGGIINSKGPGVCGQGFFQNGGAFTNNGTFNIDDSKWRLSTSMAGTGTINVLDGGTFAPGGLTVSASQAVNINGCGYCNGSGVQEGALFFEGNGNWQAVTTVQTPSCIKSFSNANTTFAGLLKGSAELIVGTTNATKPNGIVQFTNAANTYNGTMRVDATTISGSYGNSLQFAKIVLENGGRISSNNSTSQSIASLASADSTTYWSMADFVNVYIKANGITAYRGRLLWNGGSNTANVWLEGGSQNELWLFSTGNTANIYARNGARLILQGATFTGTNGQVRITPGGTVSGGTSWASSTTYLLIDGTSKLEVRNVPGFGVGRINCAGGSGLDVRTGWKVDWPDAGTPAGTYPLIVANARTGPLPTTGLNNTGRTITYAWSGNNLMATLV